MKNKLCKKIASLLLAGAMVIGSFSTGFASEVDPSDVQTMSVSDDGSAYEVFMENEKTSDEDTISQETEQSVSESGAVSSEEIQNNEDSSQTEVPVVRGIDGSVSTDNSVNNSNNSSVSGTDTSSANIEVQEPQSDTEAIVETIEEEEAEEETEEDIIDYSYGLYGGYDGQDSMNDPDSAGSCVGWDLSTFSAISSDSGLWWIDDYYVGESNSYDVEKTADFSLKYQVEFHASEDLAAGAVEIIIDASLGTYRNGNNIIPTELGIPYGTPTSYTESSSSPFNYYYIDANGNILTDSQAKTAAGVRLVIWNYRDIVSGSNAMFQVLYKSLDVMQIPDMTDWSLKLSASVNIGEDGTTNIETVNGNTLSGLVDTAATLTSVTKKAYTATGLSYTPELYTQSQVNSYINGTIGEPYASNFDDYIYLVWYITLKGSATQAYEITIDEDTFADITQSGSVVGYKVNTSSSATSSGVSYTYGTDSDGNPTLTFSSSSQRSFSAGFYVVTAYDADTYELDTEIENDVDITVHPVDGYDENVTKSASASTTWGEYEWVYSGDTIGIKKYVDTSGTKTSKTYSAYETLYELQKADGKDTGEFTFHTQSTDRGYAFTHNVDGTGVGEYIDGTYYTTTTVDDALYIYPNGGTTPSQMLTKDDYYFSSVKVVTTDNGYDVWEDKTAGAVASDTVDQDVYIYAMYYDQGDGADEDGWEYVGKVPFSTSGTMTYTFSTDDLARQPYRVKAVHNTINYATYCTITLGVTLRGNSPTIAEILEEYGDDLTSLKIENLSGVAGQAYGQDARPGTVYVNGKEYHDGDYFQDTSIENGNYSEKDTVTGETLAEFTENLYGTILMRDNSYSTLTQLDETSASFKSVSTENDTANARVLANYYLTAYEAYYVTGTSTVDYLKSAGISMPDRNEVSYYDLLPYGMKFNPNTTVVAGRITSMNSSGSWKTNTGAWSTSGVTVKVDDSDVITNWNNTGRTMVIFHIYYDGDDASAFYDVSNSDQDLWYQGFGIYFQAYYDWADMDAVDAEYNIAAYIAENVEDETQQLLGVHDSTVWKDDGSANLTAQYEPFIGISDLNGDGITDLYTNMYASTSTTTNVPISSSDNIKKLVRADDDAVAEYDTTAVVGNGRGYTYEVSLTNNYGATLSDVVLYDRLEYSVEDGREEVENESNPDSVFRGLTSDEINNHWTGTFTGLSLTALTDVGIDPVVYYSADRNAPISENDEDGKAKTTPSEVLTEANGWYTEERFVETYGSLSEVKAIAIDITYTTGGDKFTLEAGDSLSYQIHMTAPDGSDYTYAFNNPSYYSVSTSDTGDVTSSTDIGDTVRVELGEAGTVAVEKEFSNADAVPSSMKNSSFTFEITRNGQVLAGQEYMVYTWDEDTEDWVSSNVIRSTNSKGQFTLKAGQKAVFTQLVDVEDVEITEIESVLWALEEAELELNETEHELYCLFENSYRSPVYLYKTAKTTDYATEEELDSAEFTFLIEVDINGDGNYVPYANGEYVYVKEVLTDGSSPEVDTSKGDNGYAYTNENGELTLGLDDIIAFFPCDSEGNYIDVSYRITEISMGEAWVCLDSETVSGTTVAAGTSETITNYYKYRDLILTKSLSDYDKDESVCEDEWTFKLTDESGEAVSGNHWYMIDSSGNVVEGVEGYLDGNGEFSFSGAGSGRRVVIEGLVEGEKYILTETDWDEMLYETVNDGTVSTTMPVYSVSKSVSITNKYLLKDLEVSKLLLSKDTSSDVSEYEFTFTLEKYENGSYVPVSGATYTINGVEYETGSDGTFTLKSNETAVFDDIGYQGDKYRITETPDGDFEQIYPADNGSFEATLGSDGDSVRFINGNFDDIVSLTKELSGLDETGESFADIVKEDNASITVKDDDDEVPYAVDVTFGVYDGDSLVTSSAGALIDYTDSNSSYPFVYIKVSADGSYVLKSYNGGEITESLAPYDYIYIAEIGDYAVKVSEDTDMERVILDVTNDVAGEIGSDEILSEGSVMSGSAMSNENIVLINDISSAHKQSEIYKLMSDTSDEVPASSEITFRVEIYNESTGTWSPASGIRYITMNGYTGGYDTADCVPTSSVLTTGTDGKITLTKSENGYPYIRFVDDEVYVNVYDGMEDGTLRIVEVASGTDTEWGWILGYDGDGWVDGPALDVTYGDTFVDGNDENLVFEVEKEMSDGSNPDDEFTFNLIHVISASTSPITTLDEVNDSEVGAGVYYIVYDVETGAFVSDGYTDDNGCFKLKAGQYAKFFVPAASTWYVYEGIMPSYTLEDVVANSDVADNASIVDDVNGMVQNDTNAYATAKITLTLTDSETGEPLAGGVFTLYKDGVAIQAGLTTDENGQIVIGGLTAGEYYFEETSAPDGYDLPDNAVSDTVKVASSLVKAESYELAMTNEETVVAVKYAVKLWGICTDTYSYDDGGTTGTASLTFGPATGANHLTDYVECDSETCIHKLSWDEIISLCEENQGNESALQSLFGSCLENGCTKSVNLEPNETLFNMTTVDNYLSNSSYTGDGVSCLYYLLNGTGSTSYTYGANWNQSYTGYSSSNPANVYSRSRIRATLIGDSTDAKEQVESGKNDYYGVDTMCDESNCLLSCFPANLQSAIVPRTTLNTGNATSGTSASDKTTYDKLFLFSLKETGLTYAYDDGGGDDYGVNSSNSDRIAYEFSNANASASSSRSWWSRSRYSSSTSSATRVNASGSVDYNVVNNTYGLAPGFCIK